MSSLVSGVKDVRSIRRQRKGRSPKVDQAHVHLGTGRTSCVTVAHAESYEIAGTL